MSPITKEKEPVLYVGAGKATIHFEPEIFPTWEGYTGIHDDPMVEVVIIECGERFCLVNFELISLNDEIQNFKKLINELTGIPEENCWICVSHVLPTPHLWLEEHRKTQADVEKNQIMLSAIRSALTSAAKTAFEHKYKARFGIGSGSCAANVNRCVRTDQGWWLGCNDEGPVDHTVTVFRFDRLDGSPIAILFNFHAQASILDDVYTKSGDRLVSSDLAGASARFVEQEFGEDVVAAYLLGAGGDSAPALKGVRTVVGKGGKRRDIAMAEEAYLLVDILGERLGQAVVHIAERISCANLDKPLRMIHDTITLKGQVIPPTKSITPHIEYQYIPQADVTTPIEILKIGDAALVGIKPEINCKTLRQIKDSSPFSETGLLTFVNGGAKYMPESGMYDMVTYQSMNSRFAKGSAEQFSARIIEDLNQIRTEAFDKEKTE